VFFALWPDDATREALAQATRKAVRASGGRPIPVANLHGTLLFIGSVPAERVSELEQAASAVPLPSFTLLFDQIEYWPKQRVLCTTAPVVPDEARQLAATLHSNVAHAGFTPDVKPFRAHVTVARKVVKPHALGPMPPVHWAVKGFALVESETLPEGSRYTVVRRW
jgi:RNA 2',3'-cyclic 3'-phosphodiesterase